MLFTGEAPQGGYTEDINWLGILVWPFWKVLVFQMVALQASNDYYVVDPGLEWEQSLIGVKVSPYQVPEGEDSF